MGSLAEEEPMSEADVQMQMTDQVDNMVASLPSMGIAAKPGPCMAAFIRTGVISVGIVLIASSIAPGVQAYAGPISIAVALGNVALWRAAYMSVGTFAEPQRRVLMVGDGPAAHALL